MKRWFTSECRAGRSSWHGHAARNIILWAAVLGVSFSIMTPALAATGPWVLENNTDLRTGPGLTYAVGGLVGRGVTVTVTGGQGDWDHVQTPDGSSGWMDKEGLTTFPAPGTTQTINWPEVTIFQGPGTGYPPTDWLKRGDEVRVLGQNGAWSLVTAADGAAGWLPADLLTNNPTAATTPLPSALLPTVSSLSVLSGPGTGTTPVATVGPEDLLTVQGAFGDWYHVQTPDGVSGWVYGGSTAPAQLPAKDGQTLYSVTQSPLNLFQGAGTGFPVVAAAQQNDYFSVVGADGAWLKIQLNSGVQGWVPAAAVTDKITGPETNTSVISGKGIWYEANDQITDATDFSSQSFRDAGITHIYVQAGTSTDGFPSAWKKELNVLLPTAHSAHIKVIVWVYVGLSNIAADAALTGQVANYVTPDGQRADGVAADIEELPANPQAAMELLAGYASLARPLLPKGMPLVAVTYPPQYEANYPFAAMAADFDALVLMDYWHTGVGNYGYEGAADFVRDSVVLLRNKAGSSVPVEVILQGFDGGTGLPDQREMLGALSATNLAQGYSVYTWRSMNGLLRQTFSSFH